MGLSKKQKKRSVLARVPEHATNALELPIHRAVRSLTQYELERTPSEVRAAFDFSVVPVGVVQDLDRPRSSVRAPAAAVSAPADGVSFVGVNLVVSFDRQLRHFWRARLYLLALGVFIPECTPCAHRSQVQADTLFEITLEERAMEDVGTARCVSSAPQTRPQTGLCD